MNSRNLNNLKNLKMNRKDEQRTTEQPTAIKQHRYKHSLTSSCKVKRQVKVNLGLVGLGGLSVVPKTSLGLGLESWRPRGNNKKVAENAVKIKTA